MRHADSLVEAFTAFDYTARCGLLVDVTVATTLLRERPPRAPVQSLVALASLWDVVLLIATRHDLHSLGAIWQSPVCRRCTLLSRHDLSGEGLSLAIQHLAAVADHSPTSQLALPSVLQTLDHRVPVEVRLLLRQVAAEPDEWTAKRLAAAQGTTLRSLERRHERWALPSPAALIRMLRAERRRAMAALEEDPSRRTASLEQTALAEKGQRG